MFFESFPYLLFSGFRLFPPPEIFSPGSLYMMMWRARNTHSSAAQAELYHRFLVAKLFPALSGINGSIVLSELMSDNLSVDWWRVHQGEGLWQGCIIPWRLDGVVEGGWFLILQLLRMSGSGNMSTQGWVGATSNCSGWGVNGSWSTRGWDLQLLRAQCEGT